MAGANCYLQGQGKVLRSYLDPLVSNCLRELLRPASRGSLLRAEPGFHVVPSVPAREGGAVLPACWYLPGSPALSPSMVGHFVTLFQNKGAEIQSGEVTCPKSHSRGAGIPSIVCPA